MRILLDQNISFRVARKLKGFFPGSKHVSDCGLMNSTDSEIWDYAKKNGYSIVTFDADFYDISIINGHPPKIVWIRSGNLITKDIVSLLIHHKDSIEFFITSKDFSDVACLEIE